MTTDYQGIIEQWRSGVQHFTVRSSGTTGAPAAFVLDRELIEISCRNTGEFLGVGPQDSILCCLPLDRVGGLMQIFRAEVWQIPVEVVEPSAEPLLHDQSHASITSLTPMQLQLSLSNPHSRERLRRFRVILIGGGELPEKTESMLQELSGPDVWHTYGMTETYSHIAMRKAGRDEGFTCILPTDLELDARGCLKIRNLLTRHEWLQTNDLAEISGSGNFRILGRADDIINSGGVKIVPGEVEALIAQHTRLPEGSFFVAGLPDELTGEKLVLVLLTGTEPPDLSAVPFPHGYLKPRDIVYRDQFLYTDTQKLRRKASLLSGK